MLTVGILGCNKTSEKEKEPEIKSSIEHLPPSIAVDCMASSFMEGISMYSNDNDLYIIKGIVLDNIEYGLKIKLIEDLKGNFPESVSEFIAWGNGNAFIELNRLDNLTLYSKQDELYMLLTPTRDILAEMVPPDSKWLEKAEDYTTLNCTFSVLKLSDGYVSGYILANNGLYDNEQTMSHNDFQKKLNELLTK